MKKVTCMFMALMLTLGAVSTALASDYSMDQAISPTAQLTTISFSALAFMTGDANCDSFLPPGKIADYFGFQYMRDVDQAGYGHNTQFLTRAANTVLAILTDAQKQTLIDLANEQAPLYEQFVYNRLPMIVAFRQLQTDSSLTLNHENVMNFFTVLYQIDAELSIGRAKVTGEILKSLTKEQQEAFRALCFDDFSTWNENATEDEALKRSMSPRTFVCYMTYASEMLSWYLGSAESDAYFCPERHGTCFGGFYMKDQPAMNQPDYFISTATTGDKGKDFMSLLSEKQQLMMQNILDKQQTWLEAVVTLRRNICAELRKYMTDDQTADEDALRMMILRYGSLEGRMTALYAETFCQIYDQLTDDQKNAMMQLREQYVFAEKPYLFSEPMNISMDFDVGFFFADDEITDISLLPLPENLNAKEQKKK